MTAHARLERAVTVRLAGYAADEDTGAAHAQLLEPGRYLVVSDGPFRCRAGNVPSLSVDDITMSTPVPVALELPDVVTFAAASFGGVVRVWLMPVDDIAASTSAPGQLAAALSPSFSACR